jgi:ADP-heptose:LPS heptosyltransferase
MLYNPAALAAFFRLCRQLRHNSFDAVFDFQGLFRTAFMASVSGCKNRFGMASGREFSRFFYTHRIQKPPDSPHVVDYYMNLVRAAGAADLEVEFTLPRDAAAEKSMKRLLAANGITSQRYAVLVPGSAHADKCWPIDRFTELAGTLS